MEGNKNRSRDQFILSYFVQQEKSTNLSLRSRIIFNYNIIDHQLIERNILNRPVLFLL